MKIAQITPGVIPIPPKGWGAVEKIIWEYTKTLRNLGHEVEILFTDDIKAGQWDVVHVHMANLALLLKSRGIPYVFSHHDHHAFHFGKDSDVYKQNREAIEGSVFSFVHAKYLVDFFNVPGKIRFLSHGANISDYSFEDRSREVLDGKTSLVMMANNGLGGNPMYDRKGFKPGIEAAKKLNLPLTLICKSDGNRQLIDSFDSYPKLRVLYDLNYEDSITELKKHHIFLNPSMLEAGHPNLTVAESISLGIPVVATSESEMPGLKRIQLQNLNVDPNKLAVSIQNVIDSYSKYVLECETNRGLLSWETVVSKMLMDYSRFFKISQKDLLFTTYSNFSKKIGGKNSNSGYYSRFQENPYLYKAKQTDEDVSVSFVDEITGSVIHQTILGKHPRTWISPPDIKNRFIQWKILVREGIHIKFESRMDLRNKHVLVCPDKDLCEMDLEKIRTFSEVTGCFITLDGDKKRNKFFSNANPEKELYYRILNFDQIQDFFEQHPFAQRKILLDFAPSALGDNLAFMPYANELGKKIGQKVLVKSSHRDLFDGIFDYIEFVENSDCTEYALINYLFDKPLQRGFSDQLGLEFKEIRPKVRKSRKKFSGVPGRYVCFSMHSTAQAKNWNNNNAWSKLCDELKSCGLTPVCIDRHSAFGIDGFMNPIPDNCVNQTGGDLDHMMSVIENCEFFLGLSSGLSWLAHAMGKRVVLISGITTPDNEFTIDCLRIHRDDVCNSCFNNPKEHKFDSGDWLWCPVHKNSSRRFECTKKISAKQVMDKLAEAGWINRV